VPDLHAPFHDEDLLIETVKRGKKEGCTIALQGGDLFDGYATSRWLQYKDVDPLLEFQEATKIVQYLSQEFDEVILLLGNHPDRIRKYFLQRIDPRMMYCVDWNIPARIAKDFGNAYCAEHQVGDDIIYYVYQRGDAIFTHAETYSSVELKAGRKVALWFEDWQEQLGLKPFTTIVQFHTHSLGKMPIKGRFTVFEAGCLCKIQGYSIRGDVKYRPQDQGFVVIHQEGGITDANQSFYYQYNI